MMNPDNPEKLPAHEQVMLKSVADRRLILRGDEEGLEWEDRQYGDHDRIHTTRTPVGRLERENLHSLYRKGVIRLPDKSGRVELSERAAEWVREMRVFGSAERDDGMERGT